MTPTQVRQLPCCMCGSHPPNHAHHLTGMGKGLGTKNSDMLTIPLCLVCHHDLHALTGRFKGWTRDQLRDWQREQHERVNARAA